MAPSRIVSLNKFLYQRAHKQKWMVHYRVVILGDARVGKSSIVRRLLLEIFSEKHVATVEELYTTEIKVDKRKTLQLELLDTAGSYPFPAMRDLAIRSADAFLLVYAVNDRPSYEEVIRIKDNIVQLRGDNIPPCVVVANKIDVDEKEKVIDTNLADLVSIDWGFGHVECSAKANININRLFFQLLQQKLQMELLAIGNDSESDNSSESDASPSRSSISSLGEKFSFLEDFYGSSSSLDFGSRKNSLTATNLAKLEGELKKLFKGSKCIIS